MPGLFAAGDLSGQMPSVANAVAAGSAAAAMVVHSLADELLQRGEDGALEEGGSAAPARSRTG